MAVFMAKWIAYGLEWKIDGFFVSLNGYFMSGCKVLKKAEVKCSVTLKILNFPLCPMMKYVDSNGL
jgi:hypothetical protein